MGRGHLNCGWEGAWMLDLAFFRFMVTRKVTRKSRRQKGLRIEFNQHLSATMGLRPANELEVPCWHRPHL